MYFFLKNELSQETLKYYLHRSSQQRCSVRKCVFRNFTKFTWKHLRQSLFFNKVAVLRSAALFKKRLWCRCFPMSFGTFLRTPLQDTFGRLLLFAALQVFSIQKQSSGSVVKNRFLESFGTKLGKNYLFRKCTG